MREDRVLLGTGLSSASPTPEGKGDTALIKLRKANEAGDDAGDSYFNIDQIVEICAGLNATEVQMADGKTRVVKDSVDAVVASAKAAR